MHASPLVLVVDDNDALRAVVKRALEAVQLQVITSASAIEGLALVQQHAFRVVLTDISMPEMDGWGFCRQVRRAAPHLIIGIMTGWETPPADLLMAHDVRFVIAKPFNVRELQQQILTMTTL